MKVESRVCRARAKVGFKVAHVHFGCAGLQDGVSRAGLCWRCVTRHANSASGGLVHPVTLAVFDRSCGGIYHQKRTLCIITVGMFRITLAVASCELSITFCVSDRPRCGATQKRRTLKVKPLWTLGVSDRISIVKIYPLRTRSLCGTLQTLECKVILLRTCVLWDHSGILSCYGSVQISHIERKPSADFGHVAGFQRVGSLSLWCGRSLGTQIIEAKILC